MGLKDLSSQQLGKLGETAVALELMKRGYDVINLNESLQNFQHSDLLCVCSETGKVQPIQVKTGSTKNIYCGLTATTKGEIIDIEDKVVCPWVFVHVTEITTPEKKEDLHFDFYILTRKETIELLQDAHHWYANDTKTKRELQKPIRVGMDLQWLTAEGKKETKLHYAYKSTLTESSKDQWDKIWL